MILAIGTPTPEQATSWLGIIENKPALVAGLVVGILLGAVIMLIAQRKGWISNATQVESAKTIAKLEETVEGLEDKIEALTNELKPWRRFQEQRMEEFFYSNGNSLKEKGDE